MDKEKIQKARAAGYSDEEIIGHLSQSDERIGKALGQGYSPTEIISHLAGDTPAGKPKAKVTSPAPKSEIPTQKEMDDEMWSQRILGGLSGLVGRSDENIAAMIGKSKGPTPV